MHKRTSSIVASTAFLVVAALAVLQSPATSSAAQLSGTMMRADIPFAFSIGSAELPAGRYIANKPMSGVVRLLNTSNSKSAMTLVGYGEKKKVAPSPQLVFHRYGNKYFLVKIWDGTSDVAYRLPKSKAEREASRKSDKLAKVTVPEVITLDAVPAS